MEVFIPEKMGVIFPEVMEEMEDIFPVITVDISQVMEEMGDTIQVSSRKTNINQVMLTYMNINEMNLFDRLFVREACICSTYKVTFQLSKV